MQKLADSISKVGLLNPIIVDQEYTLIAGLHRLDAAKRLGWPEIKCAVSNLEGLQAELTEIDEKFVRKDLSDDEFRELLLRRKEIYEALHPETKHGMRNGQTSKSRNLRSLEAKPFAVDTTEKIGVSRATVERQIQTAKNLTPETKEIIKGIFPLSSPRVAHLPQRATRAPAPRFRGWAVWQMRPVSERVAWGLITESGAGHDSGSAVSIECATAT